MNKRLKFILISGLLSLGLLTTQFIDISWRYWAILTLTPLTFGFCVWGLVEDLKGVEWLTLFILPIYYTVSVALFYFLLPEKIITRIFILSLFGIGMYALLLTQNIFSIAAIRTIQLLRAAHAVAFLLTLVTTFFLFDTLLSFRLSPWFNALLAWVIAFPLVLAGLWNITLANKIDQETWGYSLVLAWIFSQLAFWISFWPLSVAGASLFLVTAMYVGLGIFQHHFSGRLFQKTISEYAWVGVVVLIITFLTAGWG
ncbi:hypothetical protein KKD62_02295 [Patescibacteria group bacterium]|nr:hypothetical protein [Patescibacteria group bacterium]MBU1931699.1 hypothetical protein [Patescibacteria group bacterium]